MPTKDNQRVEILVDDPMIQIEAVADCPEENQRAPAKALQPAGPRQTLGQSDDSRIGERCQESTGIEQHDLLPCDTCSQFANSQADIRGDAGQGKDAIEAIQRSEEHTS